MSHTRRTPCAPLSFLRWGWLAGFFLWAAGVAWAQTWSVGVVPQFPAQEIHRIWDPLLEEVARRSGQTLRLQVTADIPAFQAALGQRRFHLAYANPLQYVVNRHAYRPLLRDHGRFLQGVLVVARGSGIDAPSDLDGERLVFPRDAFAASMLLRAELSAMGLHFTPVFVPDHPSVYLNVALGIYPAGGGVFATLQHQPARLRNALEIVYRTRQVPPHPLIARRDLPADQVSAVQAAFLSLAEDRPDLLAGVPLLRPGPARDNDYADLEVIVP